MPHCLTGAESSLSLCGHEEVVGWWKGFSLLIGGSGSPSLLLVLQRSQPSLKGQGAPLVSPHGLRCHHGREWCGGGSSTSRQWWNSWLSTGHLWHQPNRKELSTLLLLMRVEVQAAYLVSSDTMQRGVWEEHKITPWVWTSWLPTQPSLTPTVQGVWAPSYHQVRVKVYSPHLSSFGRDGGRTIIFFCGIWLQKTVIDPKFPVFLGHPFPGPLAKESRLFLMLYLSG